MSESIGNRITRLRKARGLTQEALAEQVGVSSQAVSKWENDLSCPDISLLPRLCQALGVSCDELLTGSGSAVACVPEAQRKSIDQMVLRIRVLSADGDKINVNLPMSLAKLAKGQLTNMGGSQALNGVDFDQLLKLVEQGAIGKLVEITSADGDQVEVVVE